ncbi:MAG: hypothetical protein KGM18_06625 [Sphingomonadales bacterium]|nr:hypothetical protein [Sphingomonadales bacterium]
MIALLALLLGATSPDPVPLRSAVETCDRGSMAMLTRAEPRRRAEWADAIYREQRAIASERVSLVATSATPAGQANVASSRQTLEARQQQLEDARAVERAWREFYDEYRADFLASCSGKKRDDG